MGRPLCGWSLAADVFAYGDGKVRTVQLTKSATDTGVGMLDDRRTGFAFADDAFGTKGTANAAGLTPVAKYKLGKMFFRPFRRVIVSGLRSFGTTRLPVVE